ncbi:MAG: gluconate 2-dehydrogenase subunit 3 family protein, partial [Bacteroidota bacterium]
MNRREALNMVALLMGGTIVGGTVFLQGCSTGDKTAGFSLTPEQIALLDEIAETIIPTTQTPGAKAA